MLSMSVMRKLRLSIVVLLALVVVLLFDDSRGSSVQVVTGSVVEWQAGQLISVANEQTDPRGVRIDTRVTDDLGDRDVIETGVRVTVWYRYVGERYPVAVKVRVIDPQ
jgi:hypothetical protein